VRPGLAGQSNVEVPGYAYSVGRMMHMARVGPALLRELGAEAAVGATKSEPIVIFQPSGRIMAKDQHGFRVPFMVSPTIPKLMDAMEKTKALGRVTDTNSAEE
jgi:hypothetical protein